MMRVVGFMEEHVDRGFSSPEEAAEIIARYMPHRQKRGAGEGLRRYLRRREMAATIGIGTLRSSATS